MAKQKEDQEVEISVEAVHNALNNFVCEGKTEVNKVKERLKLMKALAPRKNWIILINTWLFSLEDSPN